MKKDSRGAGEFQEIREKRMYSALAEDAAVALKKLKGSMILFSWMRLKGSYMNFLPDVLRLLRTGADGVG